MKSESVAGLNRNSQPVTLSDDETLAHLLNLNFQHVPAS
jgi:hypothetical protein